MLNLDKHRSEKVRGLVNVLAASTDTQMVFLGNKGDLKEENKGQQHYTFKRNKKY